MILEENILKRSEINKKALAEYGFRRAKGCWTLERPLMNGDFKAVISIDSSGHISGTVYEIATEDEYLPLRVESMDGFAAEVRNTYIEILKDIKEKCCHENAFIFPQTNRLADEIYKKYGDKPEFPWPEYPTFGVFKNPNNGKWYALVMALNVQKVDKKLTGEVEVMNIKLDPEKIKELHKEKGFYPAYHMNKKNWISILLNDTVPDKILLDLLDESHRFTIKNKRGLSMIKVLFVCLGNICRSPMAEFVMKQMVAEKGLADKFEIASAATEGYNEMVHEALDYRAADMLRQMKVPYTQHYSRQIRKSDYNKFDYILAMDDNNVRDILDIVGEDKDHKVYRLLDFTKNPRPVKDPWYTGNFDEAYWDIYEGCQAFLEYLEKHDL